MNIVRRKEILLDIIEIQGRIDGLTAPAIKQVFATAVNDGQRHLIIDFSGVSYMSSAGLRIIIETHKSLSLIGGELILLSVPATVADVFRISGIASLLNIFPDMASLRKHLNNAAEPETGTKEEFEGLQLEVLKMSVKTGHLFRYGSPDKFMDSSYSAADVYKADLEEIDFGAGLSVLGDEYDDFSNLFGESVVLHHHFFSYPAVKRPTVDYSYFSEESGHKSNFLHGFGMQGKFSALIHFKAADKRVTLSKLAAAAGHIASSNIFGIVILALSGGILGMHLKKSPILENQPDTKKILDPELFHEWMSYPLEEEGIHKTVVGTGIVVREPEKLDALWRKQFPKDSNIHFHAAIFKNGLWSNNINEFEKELERVITNFEVEKVVHLLPASVLVNGFIGIINLDCF